MAHVVPDCRQVATFWSQLVVAAPTGGGNPSVSVASQFAALLALLLWAQPTVKVPFGAGGVGSVTGGVVEITDDEVSTVIFAMRAFSTPLLPMPMKTAS